MSLSGVGLSICVHAIYHRCEHHQTCYKGSCRNSRRPHTPQIFERDSLCLSSVLDHVKSVAVLHGWLCGKGHSQKFILWQWKHNALYTNVNILKNSVFQFMPLDDPPSFSKNEKKKKGFRWTFTQTQQKPQAVYWENTCFVIWMICMKYLNLKTFHITDTVHFQI